MAYPSWLPVPLMAWEWCRGYWHQAFFPNCNTGIDWMAWNSGGPLDNDSTTVEGHI